MRPSCPTLFHGRHSGQGSRAWCGVDALSCLSCQHISQRLSPTFSFLFRPSFPPFPSAPLFLARCPLPFSSADRTRSSAFSTLGIPFVPHRPRHSTSSLLFLPSPPKRPVRAVQVRRVATRQPDYIAVSAHSSAFSHASDRRRASYARRLHFRPSVDSTVGDVGQSRPA